MRKVKVIYLAQKGQDDQWKNSFTEVFGDKHDLSIYDPSKPAEPQLADAEVVVDMGGGSMTPELVAVSKLCKLWHILAVGYDFFDMETMRRAGIPVANVPGSTSASGLANGAIMFMIQISIKYNKAQETLTAGQMYLPMGDDLDGKTLGLIGFGASGRELARKAKAFGMKFMIIEPMPVDRETLDDLQPLFVGKPEDMDQVIAEADFVSLHLPLTDETHGIIDKRRIGLMKPTASFINVARGNLVDQEALYAALLEGRIRGIGTDVHAGVKPDPSHPVYQHPDFYATPHTTGTTTGTTTRRSEAALENVNRIAEGLEPKWRVDDP
jgi:phosphoglycerate dehydrogenase-like enzyme